MNRMLVLLNRPEDFDMNLPELRKIAASHAITKVYLANLSHVFNSRMQSIIASPRLDLVARMNDAAARDYILKKADKLRAEKFEAEPVEIPLSPVDVDMFVEQNDINIIFNNGTIFGAYRN